MLIDAGPLIALFAPDDKRYQRFEMQRCTESTRREMDLADASLVWVAEAMDVVDIMTVDVADFGRYRLPDGRAFVLV